MEWRLATTSDEGIETLINNRQNGRRRGRGGAPRQNSGNGQGGNRIDNRARGNASQLHEKYKTLARDAQTQGDRVMTEYYLQFADHYFRVLAENRPRFEEQQRRDRFDNGDFDEEDGEFEAANGERDDSRQQNEGGERPYREQRGQREDRGPREDRAPRDNRGQRDDRGPREDRAARDDRAPREDRSYRDDRGPREERAPREDRGPREDRRPRELRQPREDAPAPAAVDPTPAVETTSVAEVAAEEAPRRRGRPRRTPVAETGDAPERIEVDRLPPSFSLTTETEAAEPAAEDKPKRRTRRPRADAAPEASAADA